MKPIGKAKAKRDAAEQITYVLDYSEARPNRFAGRVSSNSVVVMLDPDVSKVFKDGESVNTALRSLISAIPQAPNAARR
jgi:hypothetical protein